MILCIGEILVDLIGKNENGRITYAQYAGGAPFNVACGISKFGGNVSFIGNVGDDIFGEFLIDFAKNILSSPIISKDKHHNTTLAVVNVDEFGERTFSFYRKNTADFHIPEGTLERIKDADIIHFSSLMLSEKSGRDFVDKIILIAKKHLKKLSFDVNFRDDIFNNKEEALKIYRHYCSQVDIIKYSLDELILFTGIKDYQKALNLIAGKNQMVFLTLGKEGSVFYQNEKIVYAPSIKVKPVDTTGAGDAFFAGILTKLDKSKCSFKNVKEIEEILRFGNISGALVSTGFGAIDSLPSLKELRRWLD